MDIQKRALYNSLRMNWLLDPSLKVDSWQVENYREMSIPFILSALEKFNIRFTKELFAAFAEDFDSPEELVEEILSEGEFNPEDEDHIYLLFFELWRRIETDKPCLSVFCDELDYQIFLFDNHKTQNPEDIEDSISNLHVILNENIDNGCDPLEILQFINQGCANDIEAFLYDYIEEQIENQNFSYAIELIDNFIDFVDEEKWFDLLQVRVLSHTDPEGASILIEQLVKEAEDEDDLEFNLEVLAEMVKDGNIEIFISLLINTSELLETEENFQDLLTICIDYYGCRDLENQEEKLQQLLTKRLDKNPNAKFNPHDEDLFKLMEIIQAN